jgi:predicted phosphodiesterase
MYLKVISDIHIEFGQSFVITPQETDPETVLILAGDLHVYHSRVIDFIEDLVKTTNFLAYIIIPGNHEYYNTDFDETQEAFELFVKSINDNLEYQNVYFSAVFDKVVIEDTLFMFGPMWTDGGKTLTERIALPRYLNDFRVIGDGNKFFTVDRMREEFMNFVFCLEDALRMSTATKNVLVTHHLPSYQAIALQYRDNSPCNGGFAVDLVDYIDGELLEKIDVMCFGHTHTVNRDVITLESCDTPVQLFCNPRGYPRQIHGSGIIFESAGFDQDLLFDMDTMKFV